MRLAALIAAGATLAWLQRLGGLGQVAIGLLDSSVVPTPGSLDLLTIILAAAKRDWWLYYAAMATLGSMLGAVVTYRIGRKGGKEGLEKRFPKQKVAKVYEKFENYGFGSMFVSALLPPPFPIGAALLTAGALRYPIRRFVAAVGLGRAIRFTLLAWLASHYGRGIAGFLTKYYKPLLIVFIALGVIGGLAGWWYYKKKQREAALERMPQEHAA